MEFWNFPTFMALSVAFRPSDEHVKMIITMYIEILFTAFDVEATHLSQ